MLDSTEAVHGPKKRFLWSFLTQEWREVADINGRRFLLDFAIRRCEHCGEVERVEVDRTVCLKCKLWARKQIDAIRKPAYKAIARARRQGLLPKFDGSIKCVDCGKTACRFDHRSYNRHLDVVPVCASCNGLRGAAIEIVELRYLAVGAMPPRAIAP